MRRLLRYLWYEMGTWLVGLLTNWLPDNPATCRFRGILARPFFRKIGRNFQFGRHVRFLHPEQISIGDHVYIAAGCWVSGSAPLVIEDEVVLGPYVIVTTASHGFSGGSARFGAAERGPVTIGRGSWLAAHVVVAAGVTIGSGNLIGANAVVTRDTPADVFVGGVPAKVIGPRRDGDKETPTESEAKTD